MKFSKVSLAILLMSGALIGCGEEMANVTLPTDTTTPGNNTVITKPEVLINDETQVSPLFKNTQIVGDNRSFMAYHNLRYMTFEKQDNNNIKVLFGVDNTAFESNKITLDDKGFVNIQFDSVGKINPNGESDSVVKCSNEKCPFEYENDYELKLGGNKSGLSYTDYGLWKLKTTIKNDDGSEDTFIENIPFIIAKSKNNVSRYDLSETTKFTGNTVAHMTINHKGNYDMTTSINKDLTGTIELDIGPDKTNLKIDYDNWRTFTQINSSDIEDDKGNNYYLYYNWSPEIYGDIEGNKLNNAEAIGSYRIDSKANSSTENIQIIGTFGAKADGPINLKNN